MYSVDSPNEQFTWRLSTVSSSRTYPFASACRVQDALRLFKTTPVFIKLVKTSIILSSPSSPGVRVLAVCTITFCNERYSFGVQRRIHVNSGNEFVDDVVPMAAFNAIIVYSSVVLKYTICGITLCPRTNTLLGRHYIYPV